MSTHLYFIAIILPPKATGVIRSFQKTMSEHFNSHKSYRHIPHITLIPPFKVEETCENELNGLLSSFISSYRSFILDVSGFGKFRQHAIFDNILPSDNLSHLNSEMYSYIDRHALSVIKNIEPKKEFHPHITIGYRDLKPNFNKA